ncbi:hypothetical protein SLEP1_g49422 [Rubroshorea leprosula]|uniref:Uncharacterized protein n=1 Tax=Rubroshorea leprosula TaxID=152421 RepID=A0AAV5LX23_9ROSI|nr:hypothetical protein SLEP1_g49422 [Rubroshorea leprosula]
MMPLHARAIISTPRRCLPAHRASPPIPRLCTLLATAPSLPHMQKRQRMPDK